MIIITAIKKKKGGGGGVGNKNPTVFLLEAFSLSPESFLAATCSYKTLLAQL